MVESSDARSSSVPTAASRLLAAADIWSTEATDPPPSPAPRPAETRAPEPIPDRAARAGSRAPACVRNHGRVQIGKLVQSRRGRADAGARSTRPARAKTVAGAAGRRLALGASPGACWSGCWRSRTATSMRSAAPASARSMPPCSPAGWPRAAARARARRSRDSGSGPDQRDLVPLADADRRFSPAGSSVAFGPAPGNSIPSISIRCAKFCRHIDFVALRKPACPKLLIATTRVRDGELADSSTIAAITADVLLASTCPPLVHCAVEIEGDSYWDGGYAANPPLAA